MQKKETRKTIRKDKTCCKQVQRWEFKKESKKVRKQEIMLSTKKADKKKEKKLFLIPFGRVLVFLFSYFLAFFYKFPPHDQYRERESTAYVHFKPIQHHLKPLTLLYIYTCIYRLNSCANPIPQGAIPMD